VWEGWSARQAFARYAFKLGEMGVISSRFLGIRVMRRIKGRYMTIDDITAGILIQLIVNKSSRVFLRAIHTHSFTAFFAAHQEITVGYRYQKAG